MSAARSLWSVRWSLVLSIMVGALLAPLAYDAGLRIKGGYTDFYDASNPVLRMEAVAYSREDDGVLIRIGGEKLRPECKYIRLNGYSLRPDGQMADAYIRRQDMPEDGHTKPAGMFDIGIWRVWPVDGAVAVLVFALHDCEGRHVRTKVAEVRL